MPKNQIVNTYQPDEGNRQTNRLEIEYFFDNGKKSALVNPTLASLYDPREDGRVTPERPDEAFIIACAKIGAFLMDDEAVVKQLKKLNVLVAARANGETKVKDLRNVLEEELGKLGFQPKLGKTFDNVPPDGFRAAIAHGLLLKDAVLGKSLHGEFTHVIQWLVIAWQQADTNFLGRPAVDIFKQIGNETSVYLRGPLFEGQSPNTVREERNIWDLIVDRFDGKDFRSPTGFQTFLLNNNDPDLSLLKQLLHLRMEKRVKEGNKLKQNYNNPHQFYHKSTIPYVHEPLDSNIDLKSFRKDGK